MRIAAVLCALSGLAAATTLQQLSTNAMIQQSTAIVRVQVTGSAPALRGREIYTQYQFTVEDANPTELSAWVPKIVSALSKQKELADVASDLQDHIGPSAA